jgi:hypothetical protein
MRAHVRERDVAGSSSPSAATRRTYARARRFMGIAAGSFAELGSPPPTSRVQKAARRTFQQAAAAPVLGVTALQALRDVTKLRSGQSVLVTAKRLAGLMTRSPDRRRGRASWLPIDHPSVGRAYGGVCRT